MAFPTDLTNAIDGETEIIAAHLNNLEAKVGVNGSTINTSLDYLVKSSSSIDPGHLHSKRSGDLVQIVNYSTGNYVSGSTIIPLDDTIPQSNEGDEYMTLAITPQFSDSHLEIDVIFYGSTASPATNVILALFQDSVANALKVVNTYTTTGYAFTLPLKHFMVAGTTSATTFKVRCGRSTAGTLYFNGWTGRFFGGTGGSCITIKEIKA